jgi:hypothetical protein
MTVHKEFAQQSVKRSCLKRVVALVAVVVSLSAATAFGQQPVDFLHFLNRADSSVSVGKISVDGQFTTTSALKPDPYVPAGVTHVVNTANGIVLYNASTGYAVVEQIKPDGTRFVGNAFNTSAGWEKVLSIGQFVFFWESGGAAFIGYLTPNGQWVPTRSYSPGTFSPWSIVLSTDSYLFFYNAANGAMALGWISPQGTFLQTWGAPSSGFSSTFTYGVSNGRFILLYNVATGATFIGGVDTGGNALYAIASVALPPGYTKFVAHGRYLILNNSNAGGGTIGYVDEFAPNRFVVTQTPGFAPYWTRIVSTANHLFFYNSVSGAAQVGYIDGAGKYVETSTLLLPTGSFSVVATTR